MPDLLRVALFALGAAALVAGSAIVVGRLRLGAVESLLALWLLATGQVVVVAQVLSAFHALDWPGFLVGHLILLGAAILAGPRRWRADLGFARGTISSGLLGGARLVLDRRQPALLLLGGAALVVGLISAALAIWVPPNTLDSLTYHMSRVGYYLQFRSLEPWPTPDPRQVVFPANAELLILWTAAFLRSDRLAGTVQLAAWAFAAVAVYGLGRRACLGPRAAVLGAGCFALLPGVVLQSSSTQNDLLMASFGASAVLFLFGATNSARPTVHLALAGAATGLALGTKGTGVLLLPALGLASLPLLKGGGPVRLVPGLALGGVLAVLVGAYSYLQNWYLYGSFFGPSGYTATLPASSPGIFGANLVRYVYAVFFADFSGLLADPLARPVAAPLTQAFAFVAERAFGLLGVPVALPAIDSGQTFQFVRRPTVTEDVAGGGLVGCLMLVAALATLLWPSRLPPVRRILAAGVLSFLLAQVLTVDWNVGVVRYLLTACALAAPLLGAMAQWPGFGWRIATVAVVVWSAAGGLYAVSFGENKPLPLLVGQDRLGLLLLRKPEDEAFFRELEQEVGPARTIAVSGAQIEGKFGGDERRDYPLFGPRFSRTVVPLAEPDYAVLLGLKHPLAWSNQRLLETFQPEFLAIAGPGSAARRVGEVMLGRCFELPLRRGKPAVRWELWRCEDRDPRSLLRNGDFQDRGRGAGPFEAGSDRDAPESADGWSMSASGQSSLRVNRLAPPEGDREPFRLRLEYVAAPGGTAGIVQSVPLGPELRGSTVVVDARVQASRAGAAALMVDDGRERSRATNRTASPETLRVYHAVDARASSLQIALYASNAGQDAQVSVRSILAIPR